MDELDERARQQLLRGVAEHPLPRGIDPFEMTVKADNAQQVEREGKESIEIVLRAPTFVKGQRNEAHQVMDPVVANEVLRMMETVTLPGGTATQARVLGYRVAGKTGTSRKASAGGYSRRYVAFFAGLVPASNPRFSMVVVINDPAPELAYVGGLVSAPVFHNVMDGALRLMDVAPDDLDAWLAAQAAADAKRHPKTAAATTQVAGAAIAAPAAIPPTKTGALQ